MTQPSYAKFIRPQGLIWAVLAVLFLGCQKAGIKEREDPMRAAKETGTTGEFRTWYSGIDPLTLWELQGARAATAKYKNIENAFRDGYIDIGVILPNMGYHFMDTAAVDASIDLKHPEILVYNKLPDGSFYLSAVEYAVPLALSATAPEGFSGSTDEWTRHTGFGLWLLHAWVWQYNPAGVFNATNPNVHVNH